jgi:hypothetical protein
MGVVDEEEIEALLYLGEPASGGRGMEAEHDRILTASPEMAGRHKIAG